MLSAFVNAFKVPDLRKKLLFTLFIIAIYRLGSHIPVPGIDIKTARSLTSVNGGVLGLLNLFSGGALTQLAVFALGIMPYITSTIIMQLLAVVIPKLEAWQKEGEIGLKKVTQWTRYLTVGLAVLQSTGLAFLFHKGGLSNAQGQGVDLIPHFTPERVALIVLTLTAGTALIMWFGELITTRGVGNGMSILIFAAIVARLPAEGNAMYQQLGPGWFALIAALGILIIVAIVIVEQGQRRIPVQYAKNTIRSPYRTMWTGDAWFSTLFDRKVLRNFHGMIVDTRAGKYRTLEAKMIGMTPAWLTFRGMYVDEPP